jgi:1,4-dihydroxy-2-naphthoate octaprenyltransferase
MNYERLTLKNAVNLAAPHTWVASILPVLLGTELSIAFGGYKLQPVLSVLWIVSIVALMMIFFRKGFLVSLIILVVSVPVLKKLLTAPLTPDRRGPCMGTIVRSNYCLGIAYLAGIAAEIIFIY